MAVQLIEWQLYLARTEVTQKVLPWQKNAGQRAHDVRPSDSTPTELFIADRHASERATTSMKITRLANWEKRTAPENYKLTAKSRKTAIQRSKNG